jgi:bifunctional non-homologous end joining protein LigD
VKTSPIDSFSEKRTIHFVLVNDLPTLAWTANLAALELHPLLSLDGDVSRPTSIVFDLDPGTPADLVDCAETALLLRDLFDHLRLRSFPQTSGSKGMQVYVPLNGQFTYEKTRRLRRRSPRSWSGNIRSASHRT